MSLWLNLSVLTHLYYIHFSRSVLLIVDNIYLVTLTIIDLLHFSQITMVNRSFFCSCIVIRRQLIDLDRDFIFIEQVSVIDNFIKQRNLYYLLKENWCMFWRRIYTNNWYIISLQMFFGYIVNCNFLEVK